MVLLSTTLGLILPVVDIILLPPAGAVSNMLDKGLLFALLAALAALRLLVWDNSCLPLALAFKLPPACAFNMFFIEGLRDMPDVVAAARSVNSGGLPQERGSLSKTTHDAILDMFPKLAL